jgi:hypothetical protein
VSDVASVLSTYCLVAIPRGTTGSVDTVMAPVAASTDEPKTPPNTPASLNCREFTGSAGDRFEFHPTAAVIS